jgi:hypothetical protein
METSNYDYARKNWASVMIVNCAHPSWEILPSDIYASQPMQFLQFGFLHDDDIGELPKEWNVLADEGQPIECAKILHFTTGIPCFQHYSNTPGADLWRGARTDMETM